LVRPTNTSSFKKNKIYFSSAPHVEKEPAEEKNPVEQGLGGWQDSERRRAAGAQPAAAVRLHTGAIVSAVPSARIESFAQHTG